jgi:hypothetical protein
MSYQSAGAAIARHSSRVATIIRRSVRATPTAIGGFAPQKVFKREFGVVRRQGASADRARYLTTDTGMSCRGRSPYLVKRTTVGTGKVDLRSPDRRVMRSRRHNDVSTIMMFGGSLEALTVEHVGADGITTSRGRSDNRRYFCVWLPTNSIDLFTIVKDALQSIA